MRIASLLLATLAAVPGLHAQGGPRTQRIFRDNLEKKLAQDWLQKCDWILGWDEARAKAKKTGKPIFGFFTRSYVKCRDCERVEAKTLSDGAFRRKFAKHVVLFCHVTSRVQGRANDGLLRELVDRGEQYPTMLFVDAGGKIVFEHPRDKTSVADLVASHGRVKRLIKARGADLLIARIELGLIGYDKAVAERTALKRVSRKQKKQLSGLLARLEFEDLRAQRLPNAKLAERLVAMKDGGRIPAGDEQWLFYWYILEQAERDKDARLFKQCLDKVKELKKHDRGFQRSIAVKEAELANMKRRK